MGREVGKIVEVHGVRVKAELYQLFPPYLVENGKAFLAPRINTYVKTKVGLDEIICQITGEYYDEQNKGQFTGYFLELTVKGYFDGNNFVQGLRLLPMVASNIEMLSVNEFKQINSCNDNNAFVIGTDLYDNSQDYFLSYNKIIPSHIGIFGNTGSGKSNTLARLMYEYAKIIKGEKNGKLIVFDINNEYGGDSICSREEKIIYQLSTRESSSDSRIPLDFKSLDEDEWCVLLNATEATQRPVIKTAYNEKNDEKKDENYYKDLISQMIKTGQYQLVRSIQFNMRDYVEGIENLKWHSKSGEFYIIEDYPNEDYPNKIFANDNKFQKVFAGIKVTIPKEPLEAFLFHLYFAAAVHIGYGTQYEFLSPLLRRAEKLFVDFKRVFKDTDDDLFRNKNIVVIQLANVNQDMTELIPSIITDHIFKEQVQKKQKDKICSIVNIVLDEAHNLLYEDETSNRHTKITINTFEKAIKEGRKFGLFLWISSQRPSDISETIISQMHNYFIHKLVNPYDVNRIRKAVAFLDENAMNALTVLGPGECIVAGTGVNMPGFIKVRQVDEKYRPHSDNVVLFGKSGIFGKNSNQQLPNERNK